MPSSLGIRIMLSLIYRHSSTKDPQPTSPAIASLPLHRRESYTPCESPKTNIQGQFWGAETLQDDQPMHFHAELLPDGSAVSPESAHELQQ